MMQLRKIMPWDKASKAANADANVEYHTYEDAVFGIGEYAGSWGKVVKGYESAGLFYANDGFAYPVCVTEEYNEDDESVGDDLWGKLLRYGTIIEDDEMFTDTHQYVRIRLIAYNGDLYYHKDVSGEVVECKIVGKATDGTNS